MCCNNYNNNCRNNCCSRCGCANPFVIYFYPFYTIGIDRNNFGFDQF